MVYTDLIAWQVSMELAEEIYRLIKKFPREENYALADQLRRAVVSIPSNIAEGQARDFTRDYLKFLSYARGSKAEIDTQLQLAVRLGYLSKDESKTAFELLIRTGKLLNALIRSVEKKLEEQE